MPKQNKKPQTNKQTNKHEIHFVLAHYSWAYGLPWRVMDRPGDTPLGKTNFPFVSIN